MLASLRMWGVRCTLSSCVIITSLGLTACAVAPTENVVNTASPFISFVRLDGFDLPSVTAVQYTIAPKPSSVSKPVHVEYPVSALAARGYISGASLTLPVFGLYAGYVNQVAIELETESGTPISLQATIPTAAYVDPSGIYSHPSIVTPRAAGSSLGFDFIFIKSGIGSPVIIDTDAEIRWAVPGISDSLSSTFSGDKFVIGDAEKPTVYRLRLDGLIPSWAKDMSIGTRTLNARSETVTKTPAFRESILTKRCLIPADGFYEWRLSFMINRRPQFRVPNYCRVIGEAFCIRAEITPEMLEELPNHSE